MSDTLTNTSHPHCRKFVYKKYDGHCAYCGMDMYITQMQIDHFLPKKYFRYYLEVKKFNVTAELSNLLPACFQCNNSKRAKTIEQWKPVFLSLYPELTDFYFNTVPNYVERFAAENNGFIVPTKDWYVIPKI